MHSRKTEDGSQKTEDGSQKIKVAKNNLEKMKSKRLDNMTLKT